MRRVASVYLPNWPTDRLRRTVGDVAPDDAPLVVAGRAGNRRVVTAADAAAQGLGLHAGMPIATAQALVPGLAVVPADPGADAASLERLALWVMQRLSPIVAPDPPDGIVLDTTGSDHLQGGEAAMLEALVGRLVMSGVAARAAVADTWGAAHALARHAAAPTLVAAPGAAEGLLAPLPLQTLRLPPATVAGLHTLGFTRIGDLLGLPRAPLARRFGPGLWRRIDQALGAAAEPIEPVRPEGLVEVRRVFAEPIAAAETIAPGLGIEIMVLAATLAEPLAARQAASLLEEPVPDLAGLIDTLANRVGAGAVYRIAPVPSDVPERSVRRIPALTEDTGDGWPGHWPRPARLLPRPEPIETMALLPDHPPAWFSWKGVRRRVRRADGPERIFREWWTRDAERTAVRDYFRVEDEAGERYWIYRAGDGEDAATGSHRWFLHGIFG